MCNKKKQTKNRELEEAVQLYLQERSLEAKEAVICAGERLINYYAGLYSFGKPDSDEDLKQAGYEGLLKALKRYDPDRGNMFSTFAVHCIVGEIRHELRRREYFKMPDWLKGLQSAVINATEELAQQNGCMPTISDIARRINVAEEGIIEAMQGGCVSIEEVDLSKIKSLHYESFKLPIEDKITVQMSIDRMDSISKQVITLIFYEGFTQEQTAKKLGISQRQVSRIMNRGLKSMSAFILV